MFCQCGCGLPTKVIRWSRPVYGLVAGDYRRFRVGHYAKSRGRKGYGARLHNGKGTDIHRIRAEQALGKPLPLGAEVHHADGSKSPESPLVICQDAKYHKFLHFRMRVLKAGGNPNTDKICQTCRSLKPVSMFPKNKSGTYGLYHSCKACACAATARQRQRRREAVV